jgi:ABC-type arginine transport system permease subunit
MKKIYHLFYIHVILSIKIAYYFITSRLYYCLAEVSEWLMKKLEKKMKKR